MTMPCPNCGSLMVWLNGSISHIRAINYYECRNCHIKVTRQPDGSYEIIELGTT
jgi:DNA-directed RNA polymerase subunit M/transcription elongation factor TFIIS